MGRQPASGSTSTQPRGHSRSAGWWSRSRRSWSALGSAGCGPGILDLPANRSSPSSCSWPSGHSAARSARSRWSHSGRPTSRAFPPGLRQHHSGRRSVETFVGRLVTEGVLWLVVVIVPSAGRRAEWIVEGRLGNGVPVRIGGAVVGAVAAAFGTYLWANIMPYLIRPAYKYSPPPFTLQPQQHAEPLATICVLRIILVALLSADAVSIEWRSDRSSASRHPEHLACLCAPSRTASSSCSCPGSSPVLSM